MRNAALLCLLLSACAPGAHGAEGTWAGGNAFINADLDRLTGATVSDDRTGEGDFVLTLNMLGDCRLRARWVSSTAFSLIEDTTCAIYADAPLYRVTIPAGGRPGDLHIANDGALEITLPTATCESVSGEWSECILAITTSRTP